MQGGVDMPIRCGYATYYGQGIMEEVARGKLPCPYCVGSIATTNRNLLHHDTWLWKDGEGWSGPYRVVDVAQTEHVASLVKRGRIFEVSYEVGMRWGMRGPVWACMMMQGYYGP